MRIRTQSRISVLLFGISLLAVIASMAWTARRVYEAEKQQHIARRVSQLASGLLFLAEDCMMYRETRQLDRWQTRLALLSNESGNLNPKGRVQKRLTRKIKKDQQWLKEVFDSWKPICSIRPQGNRPTLDPMFLQVAWNRMNIQGRALVSDASQLLHELNKEADRARRTNLMVIYAVIVLFGAQLLIHSIINRRILDSIRRLHSGTSIIGSGDFDFSIQEEKKDEIGELSRAFNSMAARLKTVTARKTDLEQQIVERRLAEEALRKSNKTLKAQAKQLQALSVELKEAEEQERRRVAELLHGDLQQMLAAVHLQLEQMRRIHPPEPVPANVMQMVADAIEKARHLAYELSPPVLDHLGLVAALGWLARQMNDQFGLQAELDYDGAQLLESSPQKVFIFRAVQELLLNVVKHSGTKNASVVFFATDGIFNLTVSDEGKGFDPAIIDSDKWSSKGFGLLSIRERAKYAGGSFEIESAPGRGSRFTLKIPSGINTDDALEEKMDNWPSDVSAEPETLVSGESVRVMVVDDHEIMRTGLIEIMAGHPDIHVVGEASNGREAIERARQLEPNVVVMDISMPEMDGVEATRRIKVDQPDIRVIGLSMYVNEEIKQQMCEAGADTCLEKTVASVELLNAIRGVFG